MSWTELISAGKDIEEVARKLWRRDMNVRHPSWYRESLLVFRKTEEEFVDFIRDDIQEVWEYKGGQAFVLIENQLPGHLNTIRIHLRIYGKDIRDIFKGLAHLRDVKFRIGITIQQGFVLKRNHFLLRQLHNIGFRRSDLVMRYGVVRGRVAEWVLVEALLLK